MQTDRGIPNGARELLDEGWDLESPVLSLYLNIDQGQERNLKAGYRVALQNLLREGREELPAPASAAWYSRAADQVAACVDRNAPGGKTLMAFVDPGRDFEWVRTMDIDCGECLHIGPRPAIRPLVAVQDAYAPCLAIVADREHARLFFIELGQAEGPVALHAGADVERPNAAGSDQMYSQRRFQNRAEAHVREHFRNVIDYASRLVEDRSCDAIVLAGPTEATAELQAMLPTPVRRRLAGCTNLNVDASEATVIDATHAVVAAHKRQRDKQVLQDLVTRAAKNDRAVVGLPQTAEAVQQGRARDLILAENGTMPDAGAIHRARERLAPPLHPWARTSQDMLELLVEETIVAGGDVETMRAEAALDLVEQAQGAGAFLRY